MLLRITYSNTKRFLKSTIHCLKSYFAGGYQRLPKTPPCNPFSCTGSGGGAGLHAARFNRSYKEPESTTTIKEISNMKLKEPNLTNNHYELDHIKKQELEKDEELSSKCLVTRKLKELEMMDRNNIDLVLDIEEVLHYYSRLTCPVYRDIIEKFFVEMYSGTFVLSRVENSVSKTVLI
ncbi:hypothetical protein L1987_31064 [Smallanthus sonchifolius]|uniref:Uncharacterized protein n=1 Tax=Smallanthus sonchifolius TaxID=185202 RepID=A0ACB9I791_9ASTR|nr:hypothetical protein L1987_31064 [Smallanthus sonchifolius]